jgi:SAM-dependent methyltransferase
MSEHAADPRVEASARIDTSTAHPARRYDYWLGGKDNFAADRVSGDEIAAAMPTARMAVVENRKFMHRAVTYLARQAGIRQFLDVGTGIPTSPNLHEIAQGIAPDARVVYVDNDPIVLVHARALLTGTREGATAYLDADFRDPEKILNNPELSHVLDLSQPVGLTLIALLHFMQDEDEPYAHVAHLVDALPPGSYLALSHSTDDFFDKGDEILSIAQRTAFRFRSYAEVQRFFDGLEPVEPGLVSVAHWRAENEDQPRPSAADMASYGAVARKP